MGRLGSIKFVLSHTPNHDPKVNTSGKQTGRFLGTLQKLIGWKQKADSFACNDTTHPKWYEANKVMNRTHEMYIIYTALARLCH